MRPWRALALVALLLFAFLQSAGPAYAEGSRTLFPRGYFSGEPGNTNASATRSKLYYSTDSYLGVIRQQNFLYVYARENDYILLGTSGNRSAIKLFAPPTTGQLSQTASARQVWKTHQRSALH